MSLTLQAFLYKGLAIGGVFNCDFIRYDKSYFTLYSGTVNTDTNDFTFRIGPSLFYYLNFFNQYIPFIGFTFLFSQQEVESIDKHSDEVIFKFKENSFSYSISIGFMYVIKNYFGIFFSYAFTAQMNTMEDINFRSDVLDFYFINKNGNEGQELWGFCHTLSIGFTVFFDIL